MLNNSSSSTTEKVLLLLLIVVCHLFVVGHQNYHCVYFRHGQHHFNLKCFGSSCCDCMRSSYRLIFIKPGQTNWFFPFLWTQGLTPLFYSVLHGGNPYCCEILLNDHAELHVVDHQGKQEIHLVRVWMNSFLITVLVLYIVDVNAKQGNSRHVCCTGSKAR